MRPFGGLHLKLPLITQDPLERESERELLVDHPLREFLRLHCHYDRVMLNGGEPGLMAENGGVLPDKAARRFYHLVPG